MDARHKAGHDEAIASHCGRERRRASRTQHWNRRRRGVCNGTEHAKGRLDRHGPHGLSDGRAAAQGRLRRLDLESHPLQGRAARQDRRQGRRQAQRSRRHGRGVLDRRRRQGRRAGLSRQGRRSLRQQDAGRVRRLLDHLGRGVRRNPQAPDGARRRLTSARRSAATPRSSRPASCRRSAPARRRASARSRR